VAHCLKPIAIDGKEFGEAYHVAAALALHRTCQAAIMPPEGTFKGTPTPSARIKEFLSLFTEPGNVKEVARPSDVELKEKYDNIGRSTDLYCAPWSTTIAQRLREPILRATASRIPALEKFVDERGIKRDPSPAALVWVRCGDYEPERNSTPASVTQLQQVLEDHCIRPIEIGNSLGNSTSEQEDLIEFYRGDVFTKNEHFIALQILMAQRLMCNCGVRFSVGMKSGGMDGAALFLGLPTISFAHCSSCERPWSKKNRVEKIAARISSFHLIRLGSYAGVFRMYTQRELNDLSREIQALGLG
jgi:hypothetical protein